MKQKINNKILFSAVTVLIISLFVIKATVSFYSDTESSSGNTFTAGSVDLKVNHSSQTYNGEGCGIEQGCEVWEPTDLTDEHFFNFKDVKPGDWGTNIISVGVEGNDTWACFMIQNIKDFENEVREPEGEDDDTTGELSQYITVYVWQEKNENGLPDPEEYQSGPLGIRDLEYLSTFDSEEGGPLVANETRYIGLAWCAGSLSLDGTDFHCDPAGMQNDAQSDIMTADFTVYGEQVRHNSDFVCERTGLDEWDKSSLEFVEPWGYEEENEKVFATIKNGGDEDMEGVTTWELYYIPFGNPKNGAIVASGNVPALMSGESTRIEAAISEEGNYMFKAYQRTGHPGTGVLWSEEIKVLY